MPVIHISLVEGRSDEKKQALYREVTDAVIRALGVPRDNVRIILHELPAKNFAVGGIQKAAPAD